jgi:Tfp pilus assembly PilM family ATPase
MLSTRAFASGFDDSSRGMVESDRPGLIDAIGLAMRGGYQRKVN